MRQGPLILRISLISIIKRISININYYVEIDINSYCDDIELHEHCDQQQSGNWNLANTGPRFITLSITLTKG